MAIRLGNKFPIDSKKRVAVGVSLPFSSPSVFNSTYETKEQIKSNLLNYFMTDRGERMFNNTFGGNLKAQVFEQATQGNFDLLKQRIQSDLLRYFPKVAVAELNIYEQEDTGILKIELVYNVVNFGIEDTIEIEIK